jgi:hypothetical protein
MCIVKNESQDKQEGASMHYGYRLYMILMLIFLNLHANSAHSIRVLHLSFHKGCINDFQSVADHLGLDVSAWHILESTESRARFDPQAQGNTIYNITKERAARIWENNKHYFNSFDMIITSDTAPLARIFLENNWQKPLIIWVCNRFDYCDYASLDGDFPDQAYYELMRTAKDRSNVKILSYAPYEHFYAAEKGIDIGKRTIRPVGKEYSDTRHIDNTDTQETLFLYPRLEEEQINYIQSMCSSLGLNTYLGTYDNPNELKKYKGILYFPYAWSNITLFEDIQRGIIHFVPSELFVLNADKENLPIKYFTFYDFEWCDWYCPEFRDLFVYFDSWEDLKEKVKRTNYKRMSTKIKKKAAQHREFTLKQWREVFDECVELMTAINDIS